MRINFTKSVLVVLFAMLGIGSTFAQMSGGYTIGSGTGYDYSSVTAAVSALNSSGVNGAVTFTIADGTYSGTLSFGSGISGASSSNTITFKSASGDSSKVIITSTNYTVYATGADYLNFEGMTFRTSNGTYNIYLNSASDYNTFKNCRIQGQGSSYTFYNIYNYRSEYNTFENCKVEGGYYAFYQYGSGQGSSASEGNVIKGCTITQHYYYGVYAYYQREMTFSDNYVDSCQNSGYGLMSYYSDAFDIQNNTIYGTYYGLYMYYHNYYGSSTDTTYMYNNIMRNQVYYSLYSYYINNTIAYHNVFEGGSGNYSAIWQYCEGSRVMNNIFLADGAYYGFYCYYSGTTGAPDAWDYNDYWFNNPTYFSYFGGSLVTSLSALKSVNSSYNQNCVEVDPQFKGRDGRTYVPGLNNIGYNTKRVPYDVDGNKRPNSADNGKVDIGANDYYLAPYDLDVEALVAPLSVSLGSNTIVAQFKNGGSQDLTSTDVYVQYSVDSGKTWVTDTMSITTLKPGAVQQFSFSTTWTPTRSGFFGISIRISKSVSGDPDLVDRKDYFVCSGLSGTFTIGSSGADYVSFSDALKALECGVAGPVTFNIQGGTYNGPFRIGVLNGASATNRVRFVSPHVDSVTLQHNASSTNNMNTLTLDGADYVSFENMKIEADGSYGWAVHITNQADHNKFQGCVLYANPSVTSTYSIPVVFSASSTSYSSGGLHGFYNEFIDNDITGGYFGIASYGQSTTAGPKGNKFINNHISRAYYYGIYAYYNHDSVVFHDNVIDDFRYQYNYCVYSYYWSNCDIQRNTFESYYGNMFGYLNYYSYNGHTPSIIANNMFTGDNASYAIYGYQMNNVNFWHNSIYGKGSYLVYWYYMNNLDVRNNIFYYEGSNYAIYYYTGTWTDMDYNDYYLASGNLAYMAGTVYQNLSSLKSWNSNFNQNSWDVDPEWVNPGDDHHVTTKFPQMFGANVGVAEDHDQDARCKFAPSVGADEFIQTQLPPVASFSKPDTAWLGSPTVFLNANKASQTTGATWYVNGKMVSDSIHLEYTPTSAGYDTISLVMENCSGTDSAAQLVFVSPILRAPKVDFSASSEDIYTGDIIRLLDLSENGVTQWQWDITPKVVYDPFLLIWSRTHWYGNNDSNAANPTVFFDYPGVYTVKLTVANSFGADSLVKTAYIKVRQRATMCDIPWDTDGSYGTLFDNGGEYGNYSSGLNGLNKCTYLISSCKGEVDLNISQFDLGANDYLKIYDGRDNASRPLWDAVNYPDGMTGNKQDRSVTASITAQSGSVYFEFTSDNNAQTTGKGFAIDWEVNPVTWSAPTAAINMPDTACVGFETVLENTSTGNWSFIEWDLYADSTVDGTSNNLSHTFNTPGYHVVKLITHSLCAPKDSIIDSIFIESAKKAPSPEFTTSATLVAAGDTVRLSDLSTYCASKTEWEISPSSYLLANNTKTTDQIIDVVFLKGGFYTVELTKGNTFGEDSIVKVNHIQVLDYCTPNVANLDPTVGISRVIFGDIDNTSGVANTGYSNFLSESTTVEKGLSYPLQVERTSTNKPMSRKVWIDWNIDGDFDDAGELVASEAAAKTLVFQDTVTVPGSAKAGTTRMRISTNYSNMSNTACGPHQFGEFEDYSIVISNDDNTLPVIALTGATVDTIVVGSSWTEPGYSAFDLASGNLTSQVVVNSSLDVTTVGVYEVTYSVSDDANNTATAKRTIYVIDNVMPTISLVGADTVTMEVNTKYNEDGTSSADNYDASLNVEVTSNLDTSEIGTYVITYCVTDANGNGPVCVDRVVIVEDTQTPVIALNGDATVIVDVFTVYNDEMYTATDNDDFAVTTSGNWMGSTDSVGVFTLTYTATDMAGNFASVTRTIEVVDRVAPVLALEGAALVTVARWSDYTDEGYTVSDNYDEMVNITVTQGGDFENTQSEGIYELTYEAVDASGNTSATVTRVIYVDEALANSIGEIEVNEMAVYPNPSQGLVNVVVNLNTPEVVTVRVIDALGKEITNNRIAMDNKTVSSLDLSSLRTGMYYIEISGAEFTTVKPLNITK
jgi:PKD repeat protein